MKIENGKYYTTRNGKGVYKSLCSTDPNGVAKFTNIMFEYDYFITFRDGTYYVDELESPLDIVGEVQPTLGTNVKYVVDGKYITRDGKKVTYVGPNREESLLYFKYENGKEFPLYPNGKTYLDETTDSRDIFGIIKQKESEKIMVDWQVGKQYSCTGSHTPFVLIKVLNKENTYPLVFVRILDDGREMVHFADTDGTIKDSHYLGKIYADTPTVVALVLDIKYGKVYAIANTSQEELVKTIKANYNSQFYKVRYVSHRVKDTEWETI